MAYEIVKRNPEVDLYKILNVSRVASPAEIKKGFFKLARTHHPDVGGDETEFKRVIFV